MTEIWVGIGYSAEEDKICILNLNTGLSRAKALAEAVSHVEPNYEVTVIDFGLKFERIQRELYSFLLDCAIPEKDITEIIRNIGTEMRRAFP